MTKEDQRPEWYANCVNAGLHVLDKRVLDVDIHADKVDLDRQILKPMAGSGQLYVYQSSEYVEDMGTPARYEKVCKAYQTGIVQARNLHNKQKAIFLDRDGTINKYVGYLTEPEEFELLPGVAEAIRKINNSGYLAIVATNQPGIAQGRLTVQTLHVIHNKMETLLGQEGAFINKLYYCPHHPDKGFEGEILELKIPCSCRKPKPGMLLQAAKDFNIDLAASWMIGDDQRDILTGKNAGCHTALIGTQYYGQDETVTSLLAFVNKIFHDR